MQGIRTMRYCNRSNILLLLMFLICLLCCIAGKESLFAFGTYSYGEYGISDNIPIIPYPLDKPFPFQIKDIAIGNNHVMFLTTGGDVYSIGSNDKGQFGNGEVTGAFSGIPSKFQNPPINGTIVAISTMIYNSFVLTSTGEVYGCGGNTYGEIGNGGFGIDISIPVRVFSNLNITEIQSGNQITTVLTNTKELYSVGSNIKFQFGNNSLSTAHVPTKASLDPVNRYKVCDSYTIAETENNKFYIFGTFASNLYQIPTSITGLDGLNITDFRCGGTNRVFFLTVSGEIYYLFSSLTATKRNDLNGKVVRLLTDNFKILTEDDLLYRIDTTPATPISLKFIKSNTRIEKIFTSRLASNILQYYLTNDTSLYLSIADSSNNRLGFSGTSFGFYPLNITAYHPYSPYSIIKASKIISANVFVSNSNTVYTTGSNENSLLGTGIPSTNLKFAYSPINVSNDTFKEKEIKDVSMGGYHTLILTRNGEVYAFGDNRDGAFCNGGTQTDQTIQRIVPSLNVSAISAGFGYSLFLTNTGEVYSCGRGASGQLGNGIAADNSTLTKVLNLDGKNISSIHAGNLDSFVLTTEGEVYGFGYNYQNMIGAKSSVPVKVTIAGNPKIVKISHSTNNAAFLTDTGVVKIKGSVSLLFNFAINGKYIKDIAVSNIQFYFITDNGELYSTGTNNVGELGLGLVSAGFGGTYRIPLYYKAISVSPGQSHVVVKVSDSEPLCDGVDNCSGKGECVGPNECKCNNGWQGSAKCDVLSCETLDNCSQHGACVGPNTCECHPGWKGSNNCSIYSCESINNCYHNGLCIGPNECQCNTNWFGDSCSVPSCFGILANESTVCEGKGKCIGVNSCQCFEGYGGNNCSVPSCYDVSALDNNVCNGHGKCVDFNSCVCSDGWKSNNCSIPTCENSGNCSNNGICISPDKCLCKERYGSYDCKYYKLLNSDITIHGKLEGTEKITTFSISVDLTSSIVNTSSILFNYYIPNVFNNNSESSNFNFKIQTKGRYELTITLYAKDRRDFIHGNKTVIIDVLEFNSNSIADDLSLNDLIDITKNSYFFNNQNKTQIVSQLVTLVTKENVKSVEQGKKVIQIYESMTEYADIPISVNVTSQISQISNVILQSKKNNNITDSEIDTSVTSIINVLDNILQQTTNNANKSDISSSKEIKRDTEQTIQTSFSLLSLSSSIANKRIEGKAMNLLFTRVSPTTQETSLNVTSGYQFIIPNNNNNIGLSSNESNISYGAVKISDSLLYQTSEIQLSNVFQLKTFVNGSYIPLRNLEKPIFISFKLEKLAITFNSSISYSCKYFNESLQEWRSDGCKSTGINILRDNSVVMNCECDHTTSFLTFLEFSSKSNETSIAQIILSSIYLAIIIVIFIGLLIFRNEPIVKSRFLTPFIGLTAIFVDNLFSGIISNAIFQQTKISTTISTVDILGNVAVIISTMMTLIAIGTYFIETIRYLLVRYLYELLNENPKIERKPLLKIFTSKLIYITLCLFIGIPVIIYFVLFVLLRRFDKISAFTFSSITSITYFVLIIIFSITILSIYIFDIYFTKKYKQYTNELLEMINKRVDNNNNSTDNSKKKKIISNKNYQNVLKNFFVYNDTLLFRSEACIFLFGLIFFIISFCIGFSLLAKENQKEQQQLSKVILAFDLIRTILWIALFGGYILSVLIYKKCKAFLLKKDKKLSRDEKKNNEENNEEELGVILKQQEVFSLFKQYAKQEFSIENIYAFVDLEYIKELHNKKQQQELIWNELERFKIKYLETNANMELNVSYDLKKSVNICLKERKDLNDLIEEIEKSLIINLGDTYSRFIETDEYLLIERTRELKEQLTK
ncbi:hypothetical protein ABK040_014804 [Willaertia magna]